MGNSPNPSSAENSFTSDRPTTLPLVNGLDVCSSVALHLSLQVLLTMPEERKLKKVMTSVSKTSMRFLTLQSSGNDWHRCNLI